MTTNWGFLPCPVGPGFHDFAVGPTHAICNRCTLVVDLAGVCEQGAEEDEPEAGQ